VVGVVGAGCGIDPKYARTVSADRWCRSSEALELRRVSDRAEAAAFDPKGLKKVTDDSLAIAAKAPPGAFCVTSTLASLRSYWAASQEDPRFKSINPRAQVLRIREFQKQHRRRRGRRPSRPR